MNQERVNQVAGVIASLGYEGIVAFDQEEPEYKAFSTLSSQLGNDPHLTLLGICAGTADYQLAGDAQKFWEELERVAIVHDNLESAQDVKEILGTFMEARVNSRLNQQKRTRLIKIFENGFAEWFINTYGTVEPLAVWENLADALDNPMKRKTIVFAMKVYDIINLIENDTYLNFPRDIPIPCDLQVERRYFPIECPNRRLTTPNNQNPYTNIFVFLYLTPFRQRMGDTQEPIHRSLRNSANTHRSLPRAAATQRRPRATIWLTQAAIVP